MYDFLLHLIPCLRISLRFFNLQNVLLGHIKSLSLIWLLNKLNWLSFNGLLTWHHHLLRWGSFENPTLMWVELISGIVRIWAFATIGVDGWVQRLCHCPLKADLLHGGRLWRWWDLCQQGVNHVELILWMWFESVFALHWFPKLSNNNYSLNLCFKALWAILLDQHLIKLIK